jgi:quercetin dioxygenase-like cupin family protein
MDEVVTGEGWAVGSLDALGEGPGFRKIRRELGVTAFGINAIVLPPGYGGALHYHDQQEETYFVHEGTVEFEFGDGEKHVLKAGGLARVAPRTVRGMRNVGDANAVIVIAGGKDGYVGRDGHPAPGQTERVRPPEPAS